MLFGSSTQIEGEEWQSFPAGMAYPVRDGFEIVARMHYLNATQESLVVAPVYEWFTVDEASVTQMLGPFAWILQGWEIPPNAELTATGGCNFPRPMHIVLALPHMHRMGRSFTAQYKGGEADGELFLDSPGYDPENGVMTVFEPAVDLGQGNGAFFSCTWQNTLDKPLHYGSGDNEMCILFGYGYPYDSVFSAQSAGPKSCVTTSLPPPD